MPRVSVDKKTGIGTATKNQWIMGACLGSYGAAATLACGERARFRSLSANPITFCIVQITFPVIQPMNYHLRVRDRKMEAERV
jgi:hypothetical protein